MTVPTVAVIPTRDKYVSALCLAEQISGECARVLVYDNRPDSGWARGNMFPVTNADNCEEVIAEGMSIYEMWNDGWRKATEMFDREVNVAILNDDIELLPGAIRELGIVLRNSNNLWLVSANYNKRNIEGIARNAGVRYTKGTYRHGGICGWAFMLRGEVLNNPVPPIDTQFQWWCGDDDLDAQVNLNGGKSGIALGVPVEHEGSATAQLHPELHEIGWEDVERLQKKYSR